MAQIQKGDNFIDGQTVNALRLNQLVASATLLVGAIEEQTAIAPNTVQSVDEVLVNDGGTGGVLRKATVGDLLNSNLNATLNVANIETAVASTVNGKTNKDINLTPNDGVAVTGKTFSSFDGITAVVTSLGHGLENNTCLSLTASDAVYSGQYFITVLDVNTFSYTIRQTTPVASSGTVDYTKKGTMKVAGSENVSGNLQVAGKTELKGATAVSGTLLSTGSATFAGEANFTGTFKLNGNTGYFLYEVYSENIVSWSAPSAGSHNGAFTSASFTKPAGEIWVLEVNMSFLGNGTPFEYAIRYGSQTYLTGQYLGLYRHKDGGGEGVLLLKCANHSFLIPAGTAVTSETIKVDANQSAGAGLQLFVASGLTGTAFTSATLAPSTFRIFKYKTG